MEICLFCGRDFFGKKSLSNHVRWHDLPQYKRSQENHRKNARKTKLGELNPFWKGDAVKYNSLHEWVRSNKLITEKCENCGKLTNQLDAANISQKYLRDLTDWKWLCRRCHMEEDGRLFNLKQYG